MQAFDSAAYAETQTKAVKERVSKLASQHGGKLYIEIGGKLMFDGHASRVLPGFDPRCKIDIIRSLSQQVPTAIIFCVNARDIVGQRVWQAGETYMDTVLSLLNQLVAAGLPRPNVAINMISPHNQSQAVIAAKQLGDLGFNVYQRYVIDGYPHNTDHILSDAGFGNDDHIPLPDAQLVVVTGAGSNSGKLSTCLGQIYLDEHRTHVESGYAKYELFPVANLPLEHPVNLAYEAATADIGDFNQVDPYHMAAYQIERINYNRDVEAWPVLASIIQRISSPNSFMRTYRSPTDMGLNTVGNCIRNHVECARACIVEIQSRAERYKQEIADQEKQQIAIQKCVELLAKAQDQLTALQQQS
eukprot:c3269_g1_i1.p1 GENE.c3269_g1_i1~~c3269_g1_i1.p1  ORF type:complete len:358 (+),score=77.59 c3269_g1_i1:38-1111(+)